MKMKESWSFWVYRITQQIIPNPSTVYVIISKSIFTGNTILVANGNRNSISINFQPWTRNKKCVIEIKSKSKFKTQICHKHLNRNPHDRTAQKITLLILIQIQDNHVQFPILIISPLFGRPWILPWIMKWYQLVVIKRVFNYVSTKCCSYFASQDMQGQ